MRIMNLQWHTTYKESSTSHGSMQWRGKHLDTRSVRLNSLRLLPERDRNDSKDGQSFLHPRGGKPPWRVVYERKPFTAFANLVPAANESWPPSNSHRYSPC